MAKRGKETAKAPAPDPKSGPRLPAQGAAGAIPEGLSPEMFTPFGMLGLADELPVMIAFIDPDVRFRFLNRALADWFERPR
ncbi:MAG: hypothetical protein ABJB40_04730, partial [Acidobacteriota bacterium]